MIFRFFFARYGLEWGRGGCFFRRFSYDTLAEYCINYLGTKYKYFVFLHHN